MKTENVFQISKLYLFLGGALVLFGFFMYLGSGPVPGVKLPNEMDVYATEYLAKHSILNESERLVAYYDDSFDMDGSVAAILTTEHLYSHRSGVTTSIDISDVDEVQLIQSDVLTDTLLITCHSGRALRVEFVSLSGVEVFHQRLLDTLTLVEKAS